MDYSRGRRLSGGISPHRLQSDALAGSVNRCTTRRSRMVSRKGELLPRPNLVRGAGVALHKPLGFGDCVVATCRNTTPACLCTASGNLHRSAPPTGSTPPVLLRLRAGMSMGHAMRRGCAIDPQPAV